MTPLEQASEERALRADAQRNLARILDAAREVFAEEGLDASVAEVAERAGVGTATIFRRFPTKDDLLAAVAERRMAELAEAARHAAESRDPARALRQFMQTAAAAYIGDRGFCESTECGILAVPRVHEQVEEMKVWVTQLVARAQAEGEVRADVTTEDIFVLLLAVAHAGLMLERAAPGAWRRYLDVVLDGLRPEGARPLSRKPLTRRQLDGARIGSR